MVLVSVPLEVAVEVLSHDYVVLSHNYVPLGLEVVEETVTTVTRAAAEHASVVHTLRNALLEVEVYLAAEGQTLTVNSAKARVRHSALEHETLCHMSGSVL